MLTYSIGKPLHAIHRNIPFASLNLTDVGPVQTCFFRQLLLGQVQLLARKPKPYAKANFGGLSLGYIEVFGLHGPKIAILMTLGLQSLSSYARIFPIANSPAGSNCVEVNEI
jgi:hypothetical protein